ncbi:MAG: HD domain-containing protein [Firmicutes bacterium]|nr:HD domain-containing protein [Bacillota bacterium]
MKRTEVQVSLLDMVMCVSRTTDLVSPVVADHQKRVAYLATRLAAAVGLSKEEQRRVFAAGALHDIGALSLSDRLSALDFETQHTALHTQTGSALLRSYQPLAPIADMILHHHTYWDDDKDGRAPLGAQLVHLADRIDVLLRHDRGNCLLSQVDSVCQRINAVAGRMFDPELVTVFLELAQQEAFWLDLRPTMIDIVLAQQVFDDDLTLDLDGLLDFAQMISHVIDFRSRFTATHSEGVAATAEALAQALGYDPEHCRQIRVAGFLHDLGKLAVPSNLLEKPGALTPSEYAVIRSHSYYTYRSLEVVRGLEEIAGWAAYHHERLDGKGYPFRLAAPDLSPEARLMAVADVYTAVTEDRPYRRGMERSAAQRVLQRMVLDGAMDGSIVECLCDNIEQIEEARVTAQQAAVERYEAFWENVNNSTYIYRNLQIGS